jgi:glycosyltransferase involved in cell wall biosynthesis
MNKVPKISIVLPCFNEAEALPITSQVLLTLLDELIEEQLIDSSSYILCCDDGSIDDTWNIIKSVHKQDKRLKGISLAHNKGQQNALLAGLMTVMDNCDAAISIDADLQDDPNMIKLMIKEYINGKEIVYGVRSNRDVDSWFKRTSAHLFYKFQQKMGLETIYDHADYRLMSNRALHFLAEYNESNLFLRGIIPQIGLESSVVKYHRDERVAGNSKYSLRKMISFSIDGITSFSAKPMRMIFGIGFILILLDIIVAGYVLFSYFSNNTISGWTSLMLSIWFLGGLILMSIGIMGEYVGKIFIEVKHRPKYAIKETLID